MKVKNYLILCLTLALVVSLTLLFVPGAAEHVERELLTFLSTNAR